MVAQFFQGFTLKFIKFAIGLKKRVVRRDGKYSQKLSIYLVQEFLKSAYIVI